MARATTVTGSALRPGKRAATFCSTWTLSNEPGSSAAPLFCSRRDSSGMPAASSSAATPSATGHGRRWTAPASREKKPWSGGTTRPSRIRRPAIASSAGTRVSPASRATTTTATPAAPMARNVGSSKVNSADRQTATVSAEKAIVRPAVAAVRSTAAGTSAPAARSSRNRLTMSSA